MQEEEELEIKIATIRLATSPCWKKSPLILIYRLEENIRL